ncbi:replication protein RepA [Rhodomicrobium vannielii]|uniref:replication protein RepA n=1 Tax=Rhodomicrobium vannielii TaxID=1069 RepID=UPI0005A2A8AC|nr:replication protein RepA [Rhodomicrobium vannielii]
MLWHSTLTFSLDFYETLVKHALPIRAEAVRAFAGSSRKLDMYFWLNYRLHSMRAPTTLSWNALSTQFGGGFARAESVAKFSYFTLNRWRVYAELVAPSL